MMTLEARTVDEVQACVRAHTGDAPLRAVAGRSKSALSASAPGAAAGGAPAGDVALVGVAADARVVALDVSAIAGIIEYQPAECTFTARAATRVAEVEAMLAERGQYLPFEPPFVDRGATLGGTVAAALSGPGRFRYGGVRDFLLGVRFVDGQGRLIRGGGRVVKNAAGFYLQHLMLGSLGTLGVLTEVTFKVFPRAPAYATLAADYETLAAAVDALARLRRSPFELDAAELLPAESDGLGSFSKSGDGGRRSGDRLGGVHAGPRLLLRLGGSGAALGARVTGLTAWLQAYGSGASVRRIDDDEARTCWHEARELTWASTSVPLVKVATTPGRIAALDARLEARLAGSGDGAGTRAASSPPAAASSAATTGAARRYGAGGDVAWIAWPRALSELDALLTDFALPGLVVLGKAAADPFLGTRPDAAFLARVRRTLDPQGVFAPRPQD